MSMLPSDPPRPTAKEKSFRERPSGIVLTIVIGGGRPLFREAQRPAVTFDAPPVRGGHDAANA
jgi:hypothetical protein